MSYSNKIVDYYIRQEEINCIESMPEENLKNFGLFVKYVSSHILYSLIDLEFKGSSIKIVRWIENFWATHKQCEEVEPKKKEETEEERVVVIAYYNVCEGFKIPKGINLEDKTQVKDWGIKYNILSITMANEDEDEIEIESQDWLENNDYKYPDMIEIEPADNWAVKYDEEDEE
jgi:hypothetical protein